MTAVASVLRLPAALRAQGVQRYGFHGLSCESIVQQLAQASAGRAPKRLLIVHLGNGAGITAVRDGVSIDTSMGLTPIGGLIMGTRSGGVEFRRRAGHPHVLLRRAQAVGRDVGGAGRCRRDRLYRGTGEHDAAVRAEVCFGLLSLGVQLDEARHRALINPISTTGSSCRVHVLPSLEDEQIARHTWALVGFA